MRIRETGSLAALSKTYVYVCGSGFGWWMYWLSDGGATACLLCLVAGADKERGRGGMRNG
jgi:hypothetical protein